MPSLLITPTKQHCRPSHQTNHLSSNTDHASTDAKKSVTDQTLPAEPPPPNSKHALPKMPTVRPGTDNKLNYNQLTQCPMYSTNATMLALNQNPHQMDTIQSTLAMSTVPKKTSPQLYKPPTDQLSMNTKCAQPQNVPNNATLLTLDASDNHMLTLHATEVTKPVKLGTTSRPNYNLTPQCQLNSSDVTKIADQIKLNQHHTTVCTCAKLTAEESQKD
jgi:hypothetical protein